MANGNNDLNKTGSILNNPDIQGYLESEQSSIIKNTSGYQKSDGISLIGHDHNGKRYEKGFTPNDIYEADTSIAPNGWYGDLIKAHIDSKDHNSMKNLTIEERFNETNKTVQSGKPFSKRDTLLRFNDTTSDYFSHDLQIAGKTPFQSGSGRYAFQGEDPSNSLRLNNFKESDFENQDPVIYGFEIIIDAISSPLLNGSIDDFIDLYPGVSELQARRLVYTDFKTQFVKLFKTKGNVNFNFLNTPSETLMNDPITQNNKLNTYANSDIQSNDGMRRYGKKAYLSHYLQKIDGLDKLIESNTSTENKYLVDYGKDIITLSFFEDITGSLSSLSHLYKLLYWSRVNGKGMIPENLLRFNCDIIVSECRNFNRVRKAINAGDLQTIKDNVSRHIYSLKECQFFFDKAPHESSIDMGNIKPYDLYNVSFDFKYSTSKFEKWVADPVKFGTYVGYNNGALWRIGNKGARSNREDGSVSDVNESVPKFYTKGTNTLNQNGVNTSLILDDLSLFDSSNLSENTNISIGNTGDEESNINNEILKDDNISNLEKFKNNSKVAAKNAVKKVANFGVKQINQQISLRTSLLSDTISKIRNSFGIGGLSNEPRNVYPKVYAPNSFGIFFDVRSEVNNFLGNDISSALAGLSKVGTPLSQTVNQFGNKPSVFKNNTTYVTNTLNDIVKKFGNGN